MATRFSGLSPALAALVLAVLALLIGTAVIGGLHLGTSSAASSLTDAAAVDGMSDVKHYRMVVDAVAAGENYYEASARLQRAHNFPLKPFFTVRLPTLAVISAQLGPLGLQLAGAGLLTALLLVWMGRLTELGFGPGMRVFIVALLALCSAGPCSPVNGAFHECWAGVLIALSLGLWRPGRYWPAVALGFAACLIREMSLAYLGLMAAAALWDRRWREAAAWCVAIAGMAVVLALHAHEVAAVVVPGDLASQGWNGRQGWLFYLYSVRETTLLHVLPDALSFVLVTLGLFGWAAWRSDYGLRIAGLIAGFALLVMVFARAELFYWSLMTAPLMLAGLAFVPAALRDLAAQARLLARLPHVGAVRS